MKRLAVVIIVMCSLFGVAKTNAQVAIGISVGIAPPVLPVYEQPICPGDGYMWCPGYWAWGPDGYYWVPGVWVIAPEVGFLWTPGYWGFVDGHYWWHAGYWGPHIGFYGGVCYGYGYWGHGFGGGRWEGGRFRYNTAAWHVGGGIHNTYIDRTGIVNNSNRTSFNGRGGVEAQPTAEERTAINERHVQATSAQVSHERSASTNRGQLATANHGNPATTARSKVGGAAYNSAGHSVASHPAGVNHAANTPRPQAQQHGPMQNKPNQQQHNTSQPHNMQNRPAPQQHNMAQPHNMQSRPAPQQHNMAQPHNMQRAAPQGGRGGQDGGGNHERH